MPRSGQREDPVLHSWEWWTALELGLHLLFLEVLALELWSLTGQLYASLWFRKQLGIETCLNHLTYVHQEWTLLLGNKPGCEDGSRWCGHVNPQ